MLQNLKTEKAFNKIFRNIGYLIRMQVVFALKAMDFGYKMFSFIQNITVSERQQHTNTGHGPSVCIALRTPGLVMRCMADLQNINQRKKCRKKLSSLFYRQRKISRM